MARADWCLTHTSSDLVLQSYFPSYLDHHLQLPAYWADWELHTNEDAKAARTVWEDTVKGPAGVRSRNVEELVV